MSAFGPGRDPGDPGSSPMEPASPSACVFASLSMCIFHESINKILKKKRINQNEARIRQLTDPLFSIIH